MRRGPKPGEKRRVLGSTSPRTRPADASPLVWGSTTLRGNDVLGEAHS